MAGASLYRIDLYTPFGTFTYYSDTNSYDGDDLHIPSGRLYYYTVQALGTGIVFDGPVSDYSDILAIADGSYVIMAEGDDAPYTAGGLYLSSMPILELSDDSPFIGVFEASVYGHRPWLSCGTQTCRDLPGHRAGDELAGVSLTWRSATISCTQGHGESSLRLLPLRGRWLAFADFGCEYGLRLRLG